MPGRNVSGEYESSFRSSRIGHKGAVSGFWVRFQTRLPLTEKRVKCLLCVLYLRVGVGF